MAETAIILPVFCLLLFGVVQFGILWNNYVTLTDAVRAGARKAAVNRRTDPQTAGCDQVRSAAQGLTQADLTCSVTVTGPVDRPGGDVTVTATYPYRINLLWFNVAAGDLRSVTTERME